MKKLTCTYVAVMSVLLAGTAYAEDMEAAPSAQPAAKNQAARQTEATGTVNLSGFVVKPAISLELGNNDNVGLTSANQVSSAYVRLTPNVSIFMPTHGQLYSFKYAGNYADYTNSSVDNFTDHNFDLSAKNDWSSRLNSLLRLDYMKGHDGRNALLDLNMGNTVLNAYLQRWHTTEVQGMLHYGTQEATGQVEVTAGKIAKRYDTDSGGSGAPDTGTSLLNNDINKLVGTFFYKIAPATNMIFQLGSSKINYKDTVSVLGNRDSAEQEYMVGVKWDATAKTSGSFKIGRVNKKFDLSTLPSATDTSWDGNVTWSPRTYSIVNLALTQRDAESLGIGSFMISRDANIFWTHDWSGQTKSILSYGYGNDTYQGDATLVNKRQIYAAKLSYELNRWLNVGIGYQFSQRNSTTPAYSYKQNITMLTLIGTL